MLNLNLNMNLNVNGWDVEREFGRNGKGMGKEWGRGIVRF
jgi:hypothetical protein